jgi:hypothetical protein
VFTGVVQSEPTLGAGSAAKLGKSGAVREVEGAGDVAAVATDAEQSIVIAHIDAATTFRTITFLSGAVAGGKDCFR